LLTTDFAGGANHLAAVLTKSMTKTDELNGNIRLCNFILSVTLAKNKQTSETAHDGYFRAESFHANQLVPTNKLSHGKNKENIKYTKTHEKQP